MTSSLIRVPGPDTALRLRKLAASTVLWHLGAAAAVTVPALQTEGAASAAAAGDPVVAVAGDIACGTKQAGYNGGEGTATQCRQKHTAAMILGADHVFMLGDGQYPNGTLTQYRAAYDPTWGNKKTVTFPTPGDHEYKTAGATGYFNYFGVQPYYSFDLGSWHWISLNSEIDHSATSTQTRWLEQDLAATTQPCIGAFWATPRFSSGQHGNNATFRPFWDVLYAQRADLVLSGDDHDYERFAQQAPDGAATADGIRQFVVGTGGRSLYNFRTIQPQSQARAKLFGILELRLGATDYGWNFRTESRGTFTDTGSTACNSSPPSTSRQSEGCLVRIADQRTPRPATAPATKPSLWRHDVGCGPTAVNVQVRTLPDARGAAHSNRRTHQQTT